MRIVVDFFVVASSIATIFTVLIKRRRRRIARTPSEHLLHMRELDKENEEMDQILDRLKGDDLHVGNRGSKGSHGQ